MLCRNTCPRNTSCIPISNVVADNNKSFVCVGKHNEFKEADIKKDIFRHCFKSSKDTDSMFDYDEYDFKSVISTMSEALLYEELTQH
jgi:hypothetical protein